VELARVPLSGVPVAPEIWVQAGVVWLLSGSLLPADPLHRSVGVRRGSIPRGEARLHNGHGLADYAAGDLDAARREFDRAIAADPGFVDGLYNAASAAALSDRIEDAVALLRRAAAVDAGRVQVLGRNDEDLKVLRRRADVRALLGLRRPPPEDVPPPP
jgi:tetratricopeptide (TPR) repeat protein